MTVTASTTEPITNEDLGKLAKLINGGTAVGTWHWSGNIDTGEPYLACWVPGAGRCTILTIGYRERSTTGRQADDYRRYLSEYEEIDDDEIETRVEEWTRDQFGERIREPELWLFDDMMAVPARDRAIFEVAPLATSRDDPRVYRADISGIRHPDAELIITAVNSLPGLLARLAKAEEQRDYLARAVELLQRQPGDQS